MNINNLIIEVTRRCNLNCMHCLRGEKQLLDLDASYLETLLEKLNVKGIGTITFSGGEPSLNLDCIIEIRSILKRERIDVGNFYMATNGVNKYNKRFIIELLEWYLFCSENEITRVDLSNSPYHDTLTNSLGLMEGLGFSGYKYEDNYSGDNLINDGNANSNGIGSNALDSSPVEIDEHSIGELYLNCYGDLCTSCDLSYETQESEEFNICNVKDVSEEVIKKFNESLYEEETT